MSLLKLLFETNCNESQPQLYSSGSLCLQKLKSQFLMFGVFFNGNSTGPLSAENFFLTKPLFLCSSEDLPMSSGYLTVGCYL